MPHWAKVMSMSVKVLRGISIVSIEASPYCAPNLASALALTMDRVSVGSKCSWNLLPHGARTARSKLGCLTTATSGSLRSWLCCRSPSSDRLSLDMLLSRLLPGLASDCLLSMDGRTLYLFKDCGAAAAGREWFSMSSASSWLSWLDCHVTGWDRERKCLSGLLPRTGDSGDTGGLRIPFESAA